MVNKGEIYQHHKYDPSGVDKNYIYEIIDIGFDTERQEEVVIYKPLYESDIKIFVRPKNNFLETVENNGSKINRFVKIKN